MPDLPDPDDVDCDECDGTGKVAVEGQDGEDDDDECDECDGTGHPAETTDDQITEWRDDIESGCGIADCPV